MQQLSRTKQRRGPTTSVNAVLKCEVSISNGFQKLSADDREAASRAGASVIRLLLYAGIGCHQSVLKARIID